MSRFGEKKYRADEIVRFVDSIKDQDGYAVIDVNLREGAEIYNPLSAQSNRDLSSDIYAFIDEQTNLVPAEIPLRIRFHGNIPAEEQEQIRSLMHRHYTMKSFDISWDVAANLRKMIVLAVFGVIVLCAYFYLTFATNVLFAEILSIIGSFSLWEAADAFLLERPRLRRERRNLEQNINQIVEFCATDS